MQEISGGVTFLGNPLTLVGTPVAVGTPAPAFTVLDNELTPLRGNAPLVLECVLNRLKLAGFYYDFNYEV